MLVRITIKVGCMEFRVHGRIAWSVTCFALAAILYRASSRSDQQSPARTRKSNFAHFRDLHIVSCPRDIARDAHTFSDIEIRFIKKKQHA